VVRLALFRGLVSQSFGLVWLLVDSTPRGLLPTLAGERFCGEDGGVKRREKGGTMYSRTQGGRTLVMRLGIYAFILIDGRCKILTGPGKQGQIFAALMIDLWAGCLLTYLPATYLIGWVGACVRNNMVNCSVVDL
jgi:hypothetical protein